MNKQLFRYLRLIAKCASLPFVLAGVFLFIFQFLPDYIGASFWIFVVGSVFWTWDALWGTLNDAKGILQEIREHRNN